MLQKACFEKMKKRICICFIVLFVISSAVYGYMNSNLPRVQEVTDDFKQESISSSDIDRLEVQGLPIRTKIVVEHIANKRVNPVVMPLSFVVMMTWLSFVVLIFSQLYQNNEFFYRSDIYIIDFIHAQDGEKEDS